LCYAGPRLPRTVQLLVHGIITNHLYCDFPLDNAYYSYVRTVTTAGYATFSVDRIAAGASPRSASVGVTINSGTVAFDVTADGEWSIKVEPLSSGGSPSFSGAGDLVSPLFTPPRVGNWAIAHDESAEFVVYAHCTGGSVLVEDVSGAVQEQQQVAFARGPCFWEVRADGAWSLKPTP